MKIVNLQQKYAELTPAEKDKQIHFERLNLLKRMQQSVVTFAYVKKDNTIRWATGTLSTDCMPEFNPAFNATVKNWFLTHEPTSKFYDPNVPEKERKEQAEAIAATLCFQGKTTAPLPAGSYRYWDFDAKGFRIFDLDTVSQFVAEY